MNSIVEEQNQQKIDLLAFIKTKQKILIIAFWQFFLYTQRKRYLLGLTRIHVPLPLEIGKCNYFEIMFDLNKILFRAIQMRTHWPNCRLYNLQQRNNTVLMKV